MTETTLYFPTLPLTEALVHPGADLTTNIFPVDSHPNRNLPMKDYSTQHITRESTARFLRRQLHLGAFIAIIFISSLIVVVGYLADFNGQYTYHQNNGILYRTHKSTGIREYQPPMYWPNQNQWTRLPAYTPTPQTFSEFMQLVELGRKIKAKYPEYNDMTDAEVGRRVKAKYSDLELQRMLQSQNGK